MPTAGRLAGAVIFALFGWYLSGLAVPFFPESRPPAYLMPLCTLVGLFVGWVVCGSRAGFGYRSAISNGLTSTGAYAFLVIGALAFNAMMNNAMRNRYDGPMDAAVGMFEQMLVMGQQFFDIPFLTTVVVGGIVCALITEYFGKNFT